MMNDRARRVDLRPLPGHPDAMSADGEVPPGSVRLAINILGGTRISGFRRYGYEAGADFVNNDLHDQLLGAVRDQSYTSETA